MEKITVTRLHDLFVIKKDKDGTFFELTEGSIIIPSFNFMALLKFMLFKGLLHPKALEGLLDEYYNRNN